MTLLESGNLETADYRACIGLPTPDGAEHWRNSNGMSVNNFRQALIASVQARRDRPDFVTEVREEDGLLRVVLTLDRPAFNFGKEVADWMTDCEYDARRTLIGSKVALPEFRGVDSESLGRALRHGIDVEPTDSHWYGAHLEKALEYGGDYPAVLIIDGNCIARPFRQIAADAPEEKHAAALAWAGSDGCSDNDHRWVHYSRLPAADLNRGSGYETAYAWYIPGDAKEALLGVIECRRCEESGATTNCAG